MEFQTKNVCAKSIHFEIDADDRVRNVRFEKGCPGNLLGIAKLVEGMKRDEVIERLQGVRCGNRSTSCPDQLAKALLTAQK